jgi:hypothetical protein
VGDSRQRTLQRAARAETLSNVLGFASISAHDAENTRAPVRHDSVNVRR